MNTADLLAEVERHGGHLILEGEHMKVRAPAPLPGELMDRLRRHKPELLRLLADPAAPCTTCGCGSFWRDEAGAWHCERCTPPGAEPVRTWQRLSGGKAPPMPPPAVDWPADLETLLCRVATAFEWSPTDVRDFRRWARRSKDGTADARAFLAAECAKLP